MSPNVFQGLSGTQSQLASAKKKSKVDGNIFAKAKRPTAGFPQTPAPNPPAQQASNPFQRTRGDKLRTGIGLLLGGDPNIARAAQQQRTQARFGQAYNANPTQAIQSAQAAGRFDIAAQAQNHHNSQQAHVQAQQAAAQAQAQQQAEAEAAAKEAQAAEFADTAVGILSLPPQDQAGAIQFYGQRYGLPPEEIAAIAANPNLLQGIAAQSDEYGKALASNAKNVTLGAGERQFVQAGPRAGTELAYNQDDLGFQEDVTAQYGHQLDARNDQAKLYEARRHNLVGEELNQNKFLQEVYQDQQSSFGGGRGAPATSQVDFGPSPFDNFGQYGDGGQLIPAQYTGEPFGSTQGGGSQAPNISQEEAHRGVDNARSRLEGARKNFAAGRGTEQDVRDAEIGVEEAYKGLDQFNASFAGGNDKSRGRPGTSKGFGTTFDSTYDRESAKRISEWNAGGQATALTQLEQLKGVIETLEGGQHNLTGPGLAMLPENVRAVTHAKSLAVQDQVGSVVQSSLKAILGSAFTAKEGDDVLSRAYRANASEAENARKLKVLYNELTNKARTLDYMSQYADQNGTLVGFSAPLRGIQDHSPLDGAVIGEVDGDDGWVDVE